jgi:hypothetical protein
VTAAVERVTPAPTAPLTASPLQTLGPTTARCLINDSGWPHPVIASVLGGGGGGGGTPPGPG